MLSDPTIRPEEIAPMPERVPAFSFKGFALVVDDAPDIAFMLVMILRHAGYEVLMANTAADAFDAARRDQFDLVISDIGMPGMDGYALAEALRALPDYKTVPMIAVTGFAEYDDASRALAAGFNAHMKKPIDPLSLIELVQDLKDTTDQSQGS
jgi:CheY-like chemotaxis protein